MLRPATRAAIHRCSMSENTALTWITTPKRPQSASVRDACLVHIYPTGPQMGRRYPLEEKTHLIGRGEDCDIRIPDHSVSRRHARVQPSPEGFVVEDLASTNGTFINDRQIEGPCLLSDGDYLRVGNCIHRFLAGGNLEAEYHEEIYRLTIIDGLTQIHNRRYLNEFLEREIARSQRHHRPLALLIMDIDGFKSINDQHGHLCGDFILRELADLVRAGVRKEDLFARYGGEEFCLVLVESTAEQALEVAERIRQTVAQRLFRFESLAIQLTVSIGIAATTGDPPLTATEMIHLADERLYRAKQAGRNCVVGDHSPLRTASP